MSNWEYAIYIMWWVLFSLCSFIVSAVIAEGFMLAFIGEPFLSNFTWFVWIAQHVWLFAAMLISCVVYKVVILWIIA